MVDLLEEVEFEKGLRPDQAARFAARIVQLMSVEGLSVRQLATRAGIGIGTVRTIVSGRGNPTLSTLLSLTEALNVPAIELLLGPPPTADYLLIARRPPASASHRASRLVTPHHRTQ